MELRQWFARPFTSMLPVGRLDCCVTGTFPEVKDVQCANFLRNAAIWGDIAVGIQLRCKGTGMAKRDRDPDGPITIKKYANRRLYNTATSSYVTLDHLAEMVQDDVDFVVYDAKSGEDITRSVLTQIIFEAEGKGQNVLPLNFLRQLISFYGDSLQSVLPSYLDMSMEAFTKNREQMREQFGGALDAPLKQFEEATRRNMEMFEKAMTVWNPFAPRAGGTPSNAAEPAAAADPDTQPEESGDIGDLKDQLDQMQKQLNRLMKGRG
jgi:polyhydroxyalkanoate synthesis repressor PhaR